MSKHTPGPWYACPGKPPKADCDDPFCTGIYVDFPDEPDGTFGQGIFYDDGERITAEQARANTVLAAAAPDLLGVLEAVLGEIENASLHAAADGTPFYSGVTTETWGKARDVIAKARGES